MPKATKTQSNMDLLTSAVETNSELLALLQKLHLPEYREDFSSRLSQLFAETIGRKFDDSKDIYSDFIRSLWYEIPTSG